MFEFESSEQQEIRKSVKKLAEREIPRYQNDTYYNSVPLDLFKSFAEIGLTSLSISEEHGGLGASSTTSLIVSEELAKVDCGPAIFLGVHNMACELIERFGTSAQQGRYLPRLASGELLAAFGLTEPGAGSNASALKTHASRRGDNFILNGEKCYITSAGWAGVYLVFARTLEGSAGKDGISAFLVDDDCSGLSISPAEKKMGAELSPIASLTFNEAQVPAGQLLGELHKGYQIALSGLARGRIGIAAIANGIASAAIKLAMKHLSERMQFEQRLIEFQGLQFMLADMQTSLEAAQLLTWQAAHTLESFPKSPLNRRYPSHAKLFATDSAMRITTDAVQLLGGAGYIKEYGAEKLMRDAKMLQIVEGTNQIQRLVIARELEKELL